MKEPEEEIIYTLMTSKEPDVELESPSFPQHLASEEVKENLTDTVTKKEIQYNDVPETYCDTPQFHVEKKEIGENDSPAFGKANFRSNESQSSLSSLQLQSRSVSDNDSSIAMDVEIAAC